MPDFQSKNITGKSSLSISSQKASHPSIPRQFLHANISGSQSLKQHQSSSHPSILPLPSSNSSYPSTFTVQPSHFTSYSHNMDIPMGISQPQQPQQQTRRIGYTAAPVYPTSRTYFHLENPANVWKTKWWRFILNNFNYRWKIFFFFSSNFFLIVSSHDIEYIRNLWNKKAKHCILNLLLILLRFYYFLFVCVR